MISFSYFEEYSLMEYYEVILKIIYENMNEGTCLVSPYKVNNLISNISLVLNKSGFMWHRLCVSQRPLGTYWETEPRDYAICRYILKLIESGHYRRCEVPSSFMSKLEIWACSVCSQKFPDSESWSDIHFECKWQELPLLRAREDPCFSWVWCNAHKWLCPPWFCSV